MAFTTFCSFALLTTQLVALPLDVAPAIGFRQRIFFLHDGRPQRRQLGIKREVLLHAFRQLFLGVNRIDRALGHTQCAVESLGRI